MTRAASPTPEMQDRIDEVLLLVFRRLKFQGGRKMTSSVNTNGLWEVTELSTQNNIGTAMKAAYNLGYLERISVNRPRAAITKAGYARLIELYKRAYLAPSLTGGKQRVAKLALAVLDRGGIATIEIITGQGVERLPMAQDDEFSMRLASGERCHASRDGECFHEGCPQERDGEPKATGRHCPLDHDDEERAPRMTDEEFEATLAKRAQDDVQVTHAVDHLASVWRKSAEVIESYLTPLEIIKADFETLQHGENGFWGRELERRFNGFEPDRPRSLAEMGDRLGGLPDAPRGVGKIAEALNMQRLADEGRKLGLPGQMTLGEVYDRIEGERISGIEPRIDERFEDGTLPGKYDHYYNGHHYVVVYRLPYDESRSAIVQFYVSTDNDDMDNLNVEMFAEEFVKRARGVTMTLKADTSDVVKGLREEFRTAERLERWKAASFIMAAGALALGFAIGVSVMP